jgi:methionine-gamma-lyase
VLHRLTKFINGMGDGMGGVVCAEGALVNRLRRIEDGTVVLLGGALDPARAVSIRKNLDTLHVGLAKRSANALAMARFLEAHGLRVLYPGLSSHPQHQRWLKLTSPGLGHGEMLTVDFETAARADQALTRLLGAGIGAIAVSLGFVRTLMTRPSSTTASELPPEEQEALGLGAGMIRVSVGLDPDIDETLGRVATALGLPARAAGV